VWVPSFGGARVFIIHWVVFSTVSFLPLEKVIDLRRESMLLVVRLFQLEQQVVDDLLS
jgi:hypothetical protein